MYVVDCGFIKCVPGYEQWESSISMPP